MILALGRHLAESTVFALVVAILCVCMRRHGAATRYALWLLAAAKFALPMALFSWLGEGLRGLLPAGRISAAVPAVVSRWVVSPAVSLSASASTSGSLYSLIAGCLVAIWLVGSIVAFAFWLRKLRVSWSFSESRGDAERTLLRLKKRIGLRTDVRLRLTHTIAEPALAGFWKPVVLVPTGLAGQLSAEELEAVILHELAHAKRRDNWTAAFTHAVSCVFWFYPLSWWIEKRLRIERELACDEMVICSGTAAEDYVAGILKACRFSVSGEVAGVSGVCGSSLKNRMEAIMSLSPNREYLRGPKWLFAILAAAITVTPLLLGLFVSSSARTTRTVSAIVDREGHLTACSIAHQVGAPARLESVTFGVKNVILGAKLQNAGARPITQYRMGWVVIYGGGKKETVFGPPMNVPVGIAPGATADVPTQAGSMDVLWSKGAREVMVFVKDLQFEGGGKWRADVASVEKEAKDQNEVGRTNERKTSQEPITCVHASVKYPEGTVIQEGSGPEQMCARVLIPADPANPPTYRSQWITTSDAARERSARIVHLSEPPPFFCTPEPPSGGGLCACEEGAGPFSPGAQVNSAKGAYELRCDHGKWMQTKTPNVARK